MSLASAHDIAGSSTREPGGTLTDEAAYESLANERRRLVIRWLLDHEPRAELRPLSRQVAAWENGKRTDRIEPQERRRVYNALQQFHLPKLDELGVVDYDPDRGTVEATRALGDLRGYLNRPARWRRLCLSSFALGGGSVALVGLVVVLGRPVSPALAGTLVLLMGAAMAVHGSRVAAAVDRPDEVEDAGAVDRLDAGKEP